MMTPTSRAGPEARRGRRGLDHPHGAPHGSVALEQTRAAFDAGVAEVRLLFYEGPWGSARASHRQLDLEQSRPGLPVLSHRGQRKLTPGEIVKLEFPLTPIGIRWHAGEQLRLTIAGYKLSASPPPSSRSGPPPPPRTINAGHHVIHTGPRHDSTLIVSIAPVR
jgi:predicted acyl esterase